MANSDPVRSVIRSLELLEAVSRSEEGAALNELARELGLKPSTAHNLARSLLGRGYLQKSGRPPRYTLGPAVMALAGRQGARGARRRATAAMRALAADFPQATLSWAESVGGEVMIVLRMSPERPGVLEEPLHGAMAPYASASALVFQAYWPAEARAAYCGRYPFAEHGLVRWGTEEKLDEFLSEVRRKGFAEPPGLGRFVVCVPVFSPRQELIGALGAACPEGGEGGAGGRRNLREALAAAAAGLSAPPEAAAKKEHVR